MEANISEADDIEFRAANGKVCGFKRGCPSLLGYDLTFTFFQASPEFIEILTGSPVYFDWDGRPIGFDSCSVACDTGFALEVWADVLGEDVCPEDDEGGEGSWLYLVLPWVTNGILNDLELGGEAVNLALNGATRAGGRWGIGPHDIQAQDGTGRPGPMLTPLGGSCHRRTFITSIAPPEPDTTYVPVEGPYCEVSP